MNHFKTAAALAVLTFGSTAANAGWVQITDPDLTDTASNPDSKFDAGGTPAAQDGASVGLWLQDLLNLASAPTFLEGGDTTPGTLNPPAGAQYIVLHYGNYPNYAFNSVVVAYSCTTDCGTFTGYSTTALSGYRIYGTATSVPEPATLGLLGMGLLGMGLSRRRRNV